MNMPAWPRYRAAVWAPVLLFALPVYAPPAAGAESLARFTVELEVSGHEQRRSASSADRAEGSFHDRYRFAGTAYTSGELSNVNTRDPEFAQQMLAMAAAVQQAAARGGHASPPPEAEYRYLDYFGHEDCDVDLQVSIDRKVTGEYADVQGMVPYSLTRTGDHRGDDTERLLACVGLNLVVDVPGGTLYSNGIGFPGAPARRVRSVGGREEATMESVAMHSEVSEWLAAQLRVAPLRGQRQATLALTQDQSGALSGGDYTGEAVVKLSWKLETL